MPAIFVCLKINAYFTSQKLNNYQLAADYIDTSKEPVQNETEEKEFIVELFFKDKNYKIKVVPLYSYDISAKVVGIRKWRDWEEQDAPFLKEIFPLDLGLVWGKLTDEKYGKYINFFHTPASRFLRWKYKFQDNVDKLDGRYIAEHVSNNHVFPATETLTYALKHIKKSDYVRIQGWLVHLDVYSGENKIYALDSSTSRTDAWGGACESMYIKKAQINNRIYE